MTGSVLCAVDVANGTDSNVLREAAAIAKRWEAQLDVINVVPDFGVGVVAGFFKADQHRQLRDEAERLLRAFVMDVLGKERAATVRHIVASGRPYEQVLRAAEASGAGLIVIGANAPDVADFLLGPNAARVVRHAKASVYVVR